MNWLRGSISKVALQDLLGCAYICVASIGCLSACDFYQRNRELEARVEQYELYIESDIANKHDLYMKSRDKWEIEIPMARPRSTRWTEI